MSIEQLITEHLDIWTAADTEKKTGRGRSTGSSGNVYGIKKLRELILELAVRGKLVPQDASDEPASELLERIAAEKAKLVAEGKIKKSKPLAEITDDEKPFELPVGWEWVRLDNISPMPIIDGDWIESKDQDVEGEIRLVQLADVGVGEFKDKSDRFINLDTFNRLNCTQLQTGDILIARLPNPIGRACVFPDLNQMAITVVDIAILRLLNVSYDEYVVHAINSNTFRAQVEAFGKGATRFRVATGNLKTLLLPLPPIAEQHRIVAKVDELMALCDQLENQHNNAAEAHEKLVTHLLGTLTQSQNAEDFNTNWQRISEHFNTLFTTEASIDALKQTLLQLAVMGKLVPQDPNDEPASELIKHLHTDRSTWLSENQHSNPECKSMQKKLAALPNAEAPFILPSSWAAVHLIDCCRLLVDCHNKTAPYSSSGIPIIRTSNIRERKFRLEDLKYVSEDTYQFWSRRCFPESGDIMFTREAPMGEAAIIPLGAKYCLGQRTMLIRPMHEFIFNEYLLITLTEPHLLERSSDSAIGSTVKHLRVGAVEELNIPLPPLAEQHRIVSRVDALMAICDQLKSQIISGNQLQQKLADVVIEQAIN